ncbi:MAG: RnfABCDGE type electron transport complex subunit D [Fusobacteriaceae bacterium]|nr:RnfABCDGE type electron transport complex subunit D [Fusobacteriaceae bacterium]
MANLLNMGPSPHIRTSETIEEVMYDVVIALLPALFVAIYVFGVRALVLVVVSVLTCLATEYVCSKLLGKKPTILDGSAIITGILFAFVLPITISIPTVIAGAVVSISLGKMVFGGLGFNVFNPALVGRAFVQASWAAAITNFSGIHKIAGVFRYDVLVSSVPDKAGNAVYLAGPTVLTAMKSGLDVEHLTTAIINQGGNPYLQAFLGKMGGCIGEVSSLAILLGGLYLIYKKQIDFKIPVITIGTVFLLTWAMGANPLMHIFSGGLFLGAFFMATDMVTRPVTCLGRVIYSIMLGGLISLIRIKGGYPEGTAYAILIMNGITPLIERYTGPKKFGEVKANEK